MEKKFKNTTLGFLGVLLMSFMLVSAVVYPVPFTDNNEANVAVVYGASAAATDSTAADSLVNSLADGLITPEELDRILSAGVTEDRIELGETIGGNGDIRAILTDNRINSLFDGKIDWDDGEDTDSYNVHEELRIGDLIIETTLDNNDLEGVALTNNKGLEYRLVFEDVLDISKLSNDDADTLDISILGKEYSIEDAGENSITIITAESIIIAGGASTTIEGVILTIDDIYTDSVVINGVHIEEDNKKTIDGIKVQLDAVYYKDSDLSLSKVKILAGGDISKEYSDGDAFIGQDEDDPEWVWGIEDFGEENGWIGARYDLRQTDEDDDIVYEGGEYTFPNAFASVRFDGLTDVDYYDYEVYFDSIELYKLDVNDEVIEVNNGEDVDVVVIKGENDDSFDSTETDIVYLQKVDSNTVSVYYRDAAEDNSNGKPIYSHDVTLSEECGIGEEITTCYFTTSIATLIADDTEMNVTVTGGDNITLSVGNIDIALGDTFTKLGATEEVAETGDVKVDSNSISNKDNDVMDHYGTIIESPENNADDDKVVFKVPGEQVYAQISVLGSEEDSAVVSDNEPTPAELNITKITDGQIAIADGKNIIVVGGSCINTMAASLLGGSFCGEEFTTNTGVSAGQVLIQTFDRGDGNVATLVAGYDAADTQRGVAYLLANDISIAVGEKIII